MKKNLVATLADENFVEQAKQLFSSVYHNAGWQGDYLLLSAGIPEDKLEWFRKKGILIYRCDAISKDPIGPSRRSPQRLGKFHLFKPEFKKWENIIFLDCDIIVKAPLDELAKIKKFAAAYDGNDQKLSDQFLKNENLTKEQEALYKKLKKDVNLRKRNFNSGVMAFNTQIINDDTFSELNSLFSLYSPIHLTGDQPTLNLFFYKKWQHLPRVYNAYATTLNVIAGFPKLKGIIIHMLWRDEDRPWHPQNYYYNEWKNNLGKAENIDISKPEEKIKQWPKRKIWVYSFLIYLNVIFCNNLGIIGSFLKRRLPKVYFYIKSHK